MMLSSMFTRTLERKKSTMKSQKTHDLNGENAAFPTLGKYIGTNVQVCIVLKPIAELAERIFHARTLGLASVDELAHPFLLFW